MTLTAIISWFDQEKGYGFASDGKQSYFLHKSDLVNRYELKNLVEGAKIEFETLNQSDYFSEALNDGRLRDIRMNHRKPNMRNGELSESMKTAMMRRPKATRIRVVRP